jgi:phospholipid transport system substrate-binding protein
MTHLQGCLVLSLIAGFVLAPVRAFAGTPSEQLQTTIEQVVVIVNGAAGQTEERQKERLREILMPRFDWVEMARQTLGKHWDREVARRDEFIAAFADFLGHSYVGKIGSYKDERILFVGETVEQNQALVKTRIVSNNGAPTSVHYKLYDAGGEWKVYDVVVEDVSLVANFRSQFGRILARGGFDDLLKQLRDRKFR